MSDILLKYASSLSSFKLSEFLNAEKNLILKMEYTCVPDWKNLKQYWCSICETYAISNNKKFIKDSNVVDWDLLASQVTRKQIEMNARTTVHGIQTQISRGEADEMLSPFLRAESITDKSFIIKSKIEEYRRNASYVNELHLQDLLYYGIIDLVKNGSCATVTVLKDELAELTEFMKDNLALEYKKTEPVKIYAKKLLKKVSDLKMMMKEEKNRIRVFTDEEPAESSKRKGKNTCDLVKRKEKKIVVKMIKVFVRLTDNMKKSNWLKEDMTETEFTTRFITPLFDLILKSCDSRMLFKPGEQKLLLVKEYENGALTEDDTRLPGPNIDGIIKNSDLDIPFSLVEVSGSPNSSPENYNHYKGDRNKLAKNLKYLFKVLISMKGVPSFQSACKIKLFGVHVYYDRVFVYSLSMPMWDVFVFKLEFKFDIPFKPALFSSTLPTFLSKLFQLGELLDHFSKEMEVFLSTNDYESSSSSDSGKSTFSNPKVSPKKRKHHQRN